MQFQKTSGRLNFNASLSWRSPGVELNDIGFLRSSDEITQAFWLGYNWFEPFSIFRAIHMEMTEYMVWDFGLDKQMLGFEGGAFANFKNYWSAFLGMGYDGAKRFNSVLRGGPSMKLSPDYGFTFGFSSNETKKFVIGPFIHLRKSPVSPMVGWDYSIELNYRPNNRLALSIEPEYETQTSPLQYVTQEVINDADRYVFASIDQNILLLSVRLNMSITPDLTVQYWGQPFIASGKFYDFKYITNSLADEYEDRFHTYTNTEITAVDDGYQVTESGLDPYSLPNRDFNIKEFLSNLVIRWEYRPGSVFYLVWSQTRSGYDPDGEFSFSHDFRNIWDYSPTNIFLLKFSYRLGR